MMRTRVSSSLGRLSCNSFTGEERDACSVVVASQSGHVQ